MLGSRLFTLVDNICNSQHTLHPCLKAIHTYKNNSTTFVPSMAFVPNSGYLLYFSDTDSYEILYLTRDIFIYTNFANTPIPRKFLPITKKYGYMAYQYELPRRFIDTSFYHCFAIMYYISLHQCEVISNEAMIDYLSHMNDIEASLITEHMFNVANFNNFSIVSNLHLSQIRMLRINEINSLLLTFRFNPLINFTYLQSQKAINNLRYIPQGYGLIIYLQFNPCNKKYSKVVSVEEIEKQCIKMVHCVILYRGKDGDFFYFDSNNVECPEDVKKILERFGTTECYYLQSAMQSPSLNTCAYHCLAFMKYTSLHNNKVTSMINKDYPKWVNHRSEHYDLCVIQIAGALLNQVYNVVDLRCVEGDASRPSVYGNTVSLSSLYIRQMNYFLSAM